MRLKAKKTICNEKARDAFEPGPPTSMRELSSELYSGDTPRSPTLDTGCGSRCPEFP